MRKRKEKSNDWFVVNPVNWAQIYANGVIGIDTAFTNNKSTMNIESFVTPETKKLIDANLLEFSNGKVETTSKGADFLDSLVYKQFEKEMLAEAERIIAEKEAKKV